ncbi:MAG: crosslink repair DNA glycosylase YcaQ family protein [Nitrolancea sp.]
MTVRISKDEAKALAVIAQGLDEPISEPPSKSVIMEIIRRIGCLQIDTISVVARSHYLVLWSRLGQYDSDLVDELHHPDRMLFEYWGHAASLLPAELFPYFRRRMQQRKIKHMDSEDSWAIENQEIISQVLDAVRLHGPISSSHFERVEAVEPVAAWSWWGGKPENQALDLLWTTGALAIHRRVNFQRHYDLIGRVFPEHVTSELPSETDEERTLAMKALDAMGIGFLAGINDYFRTKWGARTRRILADLAQGNEIFGVEIEDLGLAYVTESNRSLLEDVRAGRRPTRTTLLSPFDNLIWERQRTEKLFDFEYRLECYTPAPKRKYGYYNLPILDRGRLIGRLDPKVDRRERVLYLRSVHVEPGIKFDDEISERLQETLRDFAAFNDASTIVVQAGPKKLPRQLDV